MIEALALGFFGSEEGRSPALRLSDIVRIVCAMRGSYRMEESIDCFPKFKVECSYGELEKLCGEKKRLEKPWSRVKWCAGVREVRGSEQVYVVGGAE